MACSRQLNFTEKQRIGRTVVVRQALADMKSLKDFFSRVARGIPSNLGQIDEDSGNVLMPNIWEEPSRKRKRPMILKVAMELEMLKAQSSNLISSQQ